MPRLAPMLVLTLALPLSGCGWWNSIHQTDSITRDAGKMISVDAKQRFVLQMPAKNIDSTPIICTEPSPDAFAVYAAALEASQSITNAKSLSLGLSGTESGATIGLRTESIQLLRDAMYRLCEGYANNAIEKPAMEELHRKYQKSMVALIAIQQLTGAVVPPPVTLVTNAATGASESRMKAYEIMQAKREIVGKRKADLKSAQDAAIAVADENKMSATDISDCEKKISSKDDLSGNASCQAYKVEFDKIAAQKSALAAADRAQVEAEELYASVSGGSTFSGGNSYIGEQIRATNLDEKTVEKISTAVTNIVGQVFLDDRLAFCAAITGVGVEESISIKAIDSALKKVLSDTTLTKVELEAELRKLGRYPGIAATAEYKALTNQVQSVTTVELSSAKAKAEINLKANALIKEVSERSDRMSECIRIAKS